MTIALFSADCFLPVSSQPQVDTQGTGGVSRPVGLSAPQANTAELAACQDLSTIYWQSD